MKYQKVKKLTVDACSTSPWASHLRQYVPNVPKTDVQASRKSAHCAPEANLKDTPRKHRIGNGYFWLVANSHLEKTNTVFLGGYDWIFNRMNFDVDQRINKESIIEIC